MVSCVVKKCRNTSAKASKNKDGITFHRFPRDEQRRRSWECAVNREKWTSTPSSCICSEHFDKNDFYITENGLRRLSTDATPSINISACQEPEPTISQLEPIDIDPEDTGEMIKLKYKVRRLEVIAENRKRRLNLMWQGKRRLKKKLEKLTNILRHLIRTKRDRDENPTTG